MKLNDLEQLEIQLLLEAIFLRYGYDFRCYARASIRRRILQFKQRHNFASITAMLDRIVHDESCFELMVRDFSITVTEMFRDPPVFLSIRKNVVPVLKSHPYIKVWHAGCATGQEAYSLAILLQEEGLAKRTTLYATDFNDTALEKAKSGIYDLDSAQKYISNYQQAGGREPFSNYYSAHYGGMVMDRSLKEKITFANHNLVSDQVFSETHFIICRNVMIYFDKKLQNRVVQLFYESLVRCGFLCIGVKESLLFTGLNDAFKEIDPKNKIYQKIS